MKRKKPTGSPATWRKTTRQSPMQRFQMYNALQMEYSTIANNSFNFNLNRSQQASLRQLEVARIKKAKKKLTETITKTMEEEQGGMMLIGAEKSYEVEQRIIEDEVNLQSAKKVFELDLDLGGYHVDYTRNGQYLALCGERGHLAIIRWKDFRVISEQNLAVNGADDWIHDAVFAGNESMLCVAQREGVYVYNTKLIETHVLKRSLPRCRALDFLPYHFLLCGVGAAGKLTYFDVSIGKKVATKATKLGCCDVIAQNPSNAVVHLGHSNGTVTLWTPTNQDAVARVLAHKSKIRGLAVDHSGRKMATSDDRGCLKIWDLRTWRELRRYRSNSAVSNLDFSQKGMFAFSTGKTAVIWNLRNGFRPCRPGGGRELRRRHHELYLQHSMDRRVVRSLKFCPYEDVLGIGNSGGFCSVVVPGAGEPNYDLFEADPFETRKGRNRKMVHSLLDKLQPDMIQLDPDIIANTPRKKNAVEGMGKKKAEENEGKWARKSVTKNVKRGYRGVLVKRYAKYHHMKQLHIQQEKAKQLLNERKAERHKERKEGSMDRKDALARKLSGDGRKGTVSALDRFTAFKENQGRKQFKSRWRRKESKIHF